MLTSEKQTVLTVEYLGQCWAKQLKKNR